MTEYFTKDGDDFKKVEGELLTEQQVNSVVKHRAERIAAQEYGDYEDLKKKAGTIDTLKTEYETKLKEKDTTLETLTKELGSAKLDTTKVKLISEFKLSDDLAEFVTGDTEDEMRTRAEKLSKGITPSKVTAPKEGKPSGDATKPEMKKAVEGLFGKKPD